MQELFSQLGIDWKLLLSQAVNFGLLLTALRLFAYKPLLALMRERRERIEEGLTKADEADTRLREVDGRVRERIKEAENEGLAMLRRTEEQAKHLEARLMEQAHGKEAIMMKDAEAKAGAKVLEMEAEFEKGAARMVREAIVKTVELSPKLIDKTLVAHALVEMKKTRLSARPAGGPARQSGARA